MRIPALFLSLAFCLAAATVAQAQNPGAQQDAQAAREKLLKASDQLDNIQANSEATRLSVDGMKADVTKLQAENATLKQRLTELQAAFEQYKADQVKSRQALVDNVAGMIAAGGGKSTHKSKDEPVKTAEAPTPAKSTEVHTAIQPTAPNLAPPPDASAPAEKTAPAPKPLKGYYHTVASGETVTAIAEAYRDSGVKVTAAQIRKANNLSPDSPLKPGQKLFIPKPGA